MNFKSNTIYQSCYSSKSLSHVGPSGPRAFKFSGGTWAAHRFVSFAYRTGIWGGPILESDFQGRVRPGPFWKPRSVHISGGFRAATLLECTLWPAADVPQELRKILERQLQTMADATGEAKFPGVPRDGSPEFGNGRLHSPSDGELQSQHYFGKQYEFCIGGCDWNGCAIIFQTCFLTKVSPKDLLKGL